MSQAYVPTQPTAPLIHKCDVWTDPFSFLQVQRCASGQLQCRRVRRGEVSPAFSGEAKQLRRAFPVFLLSTEWWIQFSYMVLARENILMKSVHCILTLLKSRDPPNVWEYWDTPTSIRMISLNTSYSSWKIEWMHKWAMEKPWLFSLYDFRRGLYYPGICGNFNQDSIIRIPIN